MSKWRSIVTAISEAVHGGSDEAAEAEGLVVTRAGRHLTRRVYRDPRFNPTGEKVWISATSSSRATHSVYPSTDGAPLTSQYVPEIGGPEWLTWVQFVQPSRVSRDA